MFGTVLRGDIGRLCRCVSIMTGSEGCLPRYKPFKYMYEKEIVMYAYFKKLDYFSTESTYAPQAYRGYAREFLKDLERVNSRVILGSAGRFLIPWRLILNRRSAVDIIMAGEHFFTSSTEQQKAKPLGCAMSRLSRANLISSVQALALAVATCPAMMFVKRVYCSMASIVVNRSSPFTSERRYGIVLILSSVANHGLLMSEAECWSPSPSGVLVEPIALYNSLLMALDKVPIISNWLCAEILRGSLNKT